MKLACTYWDAVRILSEWHHSKKHERPGQYLWNWAGMPGETWPELFYEGSWEAVNEMVWKHYNEHGAFGE